MQYAEYNNAALAQVFVDPGCPDKLVQDAPALAAWLENLPKTEKTLQLTGNKEYLFLKTENSEYVSRYRKDSYPDLSGILAKRKHSAAQVTFNRQALVEALKMLEPAITKLDCSAYFTFTAKDGQASITTKGNATSLSLPIGHKGELFKIAFPLKHLRKLIESLDPSPDGFMTMELCGAEGPMFMESGADAVTLIMPMKIVKEDVYYDDAVNA
jgi:DNA polymerase III sliding clamp (beta) subunit (PCNA family)